MNKSLYSRNIRELKEYALNLPEPVKTLILSLREDSSDEEFLSKLIEWKKLLRIKQEDRR